MGDHGRVGTDSRFLTRAVYFVVLLVLIGFQVRSFAFNSTSYANATAAPTQTPAPGRVPRKVITPVVLTAVPVSTNQINLSWANNSDNVSGLSVERSRSPRGPWKHVINVPVNAASCANAGLAAATTYYYRLMAHDSPYSNVASATTLSGVTDQAPGQLSATASSSNQIDLSWSLLGDITGFKIERCEGKGCSNFIEIASTAANVTSYQNTDLKPLTSYSYRVRAYKESSHYAYSNVASATTSRSTVPPSVPNGLVANTVSSSQITLSWNSEAVDHRAAAGYNVFQFGERIGSTTGTSYLVKRLTANTQYCYSVQAFDNAGNSSFQSDIACATTKPDSNSQPESKPTPGVK